MNSILFSLLTLSHLTLVFISAQRLGVLVQEMPLERPQNTNAVLTQSVERQVRLSDGQSVISFTNDASDGMKGCRVLKDEKDVEEVEGNADTRWYRDREGATMRAWVQRCQRQRRKINKRKEFPEIVYPGTNWCGPGDVAADYDDLGDYENADKCCRRHDNCPADIHAFTTKYHYFNYRPWTVTHCTCDETLFNCLKEVTLKGEGREAEAANSIGDIFFSEADPPCFRLERGKYCVKKHWSRLWCLEWAWAQDVARIYTYLEKQWREIQHTDQIANKPERQKIWNE